MANKLKVYLRHMSSTEIMIRFAALPPEGSEVDFIGDATDYVEKGQTVYGKTFEEWLALGEGEHSVEIPTSAKS